MTRGDSGLLEGAVVMGAEVGFLVGAAVEHRAVA